MVAWLRDNKTRGMRFSSDNNAHGMVCSSDASNNPDKKDGCCQHCHALQFCGGTISYASAKLTLKGWGSPAVEFMALRHAAAKIMKFRTLIAELGLNSIIAAPTKLYVDNSVAIQWVKTGRITEGNMYMDLSYHQPREWEREGFLEVCFVHTHDNPSDLGSKPGGVEEYARFLGVICGEKPWVLKFPRQTLLFT